MQTAVSEQMEERLENTRLLVGGGGVVVGPCLLVWSGLGHD